MTYLRRSVDDDGEARDLTGGGTRRVFAHHVEEGPVTAKACILARLKKPKKIQWRGNFVEDVLHATLHISPITMVTSPAAKNLELSRPGAQHF
jgi:hypothetical protein